MTVKPPRQLIAACWPPLTGPPLGVAHRTAAGVSEATELAGIFKALADPVRLRYGCGTAAVAVGDRLPPRELCVCEITGPTISHHLKVVREAGLIDSQRRGTWVY